MRLTDFSNFQPVPSEADCAALIAAGYPAAIVGLQRPQVSMAQTSALRAGGITVEDCYIENTPNPPIPSGMLRGWVAVEDGSGFTTREAVNEQIAYVRSQGLEAGIYSSVAMLTKYGLLDLLHTEWADVLLWLANYDGVEALPAGTYMKQFSGSGSIPGVGYQLDLNYKEDPVPQNDPNHEDGYDTGLTRINVEAAVESLAKVHKQAEGDAIYLVNAINRVFGVNYHQ